MIKTTIEQVKLVSEVLKKTPDAPTPTSTAPIPSSNIEEQRNANHKKFTDMFNKMNDHTTNGRHDEASKVRGEIKNTALIAPKGSVDVGRLNEMRERQLMGTVTRNSQGHAWTDHGRQVNHDDVAEIINHHLGDAKSLKDIHDNHGGEKTIEALMRTMGANGIPKNYSNLKFNKPGIHEDLLDLINPHKADHDRKKQRHKGVFQQAYFSKTPVDPELNHQVNETFDKMFEEDDNGNYGHYDKHISKAHENAVVARGIEHFKRHHKLN